MLVLVTALSLSSCDLVRSRLGMPTSVQITEMKKEQIRQKEEEQQRQISDSIALVEAKRLPEMHRFHIIVGSFLMEDNATRMMAQLAGSGFKPVKMRFRNGFSVVSAASYDDYSEAYKFMSHLSGLVSFAPYDMWIYDLTQNRHGGTVDNYRSDSRGMTNEEYRKMLLNEEYRRMNENYAKTNENNPIYPLPY